MGDGETALKQIGSTFLRHCPVSISPHAQAKGFKAQMRLDGGPRIDCLQSVLSCWFYLVSRRVGVWLGSPLNSFQQHFEVMIWKRFSFTA